MIPLHAFAALPLGLFLLLSAVRAGDIPQSPGAHKDLAIQGLAQRCHLYLPKDFDPQRTLRYPVLVLQSPSGRTAEDLPRYQPWADAEDVVLVGINGPRNGMPDHEKPPIQDRTLRALTEALPLHPSLRFATGMSGGSADGGRMIRRQPKNFAGLVMQGSGGVPGPNMKDLVFVIHYGAKDEWDVRGIYEKVLPALASYDAPVWIDIGLDRGHQWAPMEEQIRALTWMVNQARLRHAGLDDGEREAWRDVVRQRVQALLAGDDADAMEVFLRIRGLPDAPALASRWRDLSLLRLDGRDPKTRALALRRMLDAPWIGALPEAERGDLEQTLGKLLEAPEVERHVLRAVRLGELEELEKRAGLFAEHLAPVRDALRAFTDEPEDAWTEAATKRWHVVRDLIENPRKRVGQ